MIITDRLSERSGRAPDYAAENRAIEALASELAERPENLLQKLAETIIELGLGDSAGISIEEMADIRQFRWVALAGVWRQLRGSTIPFDASPCGLAIRRDQLLLIESPEKFFAEAQVEPLIHEGLLLPFRIQDRPVGTLWVNAHNPIRKFDEEDVRLLKSLARFASAGFRTVQALEEAQAGKDELEQRVAAQVAQLKTSEERYRTLLETIEEGFCIVEHVPGDPVDFRYLAANPAFVRQSGLRDPVGKTMRELVPGVEEAIVARYESVAVTGKPEVFTSHVAVLDRWFEIEAPRSTSRTRSQSSFEMLPTPSKRNAACARARCVRHFYSS